jgi:riboflavin kinase/FMN adenylyltransferase
MLQLQNLQGRLSVETWVTIGTFDGVHLGHQELIGRMVEEAHAAGAQAAVVTFYPHPAVVLGKRPGNINLSTQSERVEYIERLGVDILVTQTFNSELAATSAKDYALN